MNALKFERKAAERLQQGRIAMDTLFCIDPLNGAAIAVAASIGRGQKVNIPAHLRDDNSMTIHIISQICNHRCVNSNGWLLLAGRLDNKKFVAEISRLQKFNAAQRKLP